MIGVIADDLTGAAELGAAGLRQGWSAEVVTEGRPSGTSDLVCVDTDSRAQPPREAARRVAAAVKVLQKAGATWVYKKVDSVLRGQVIPELEAMMRQLGATRALLAPANPSLGRTIRDGKYLVRGKPLHQTEFARDPQFPRTSSRVLELLTTPQLFSLCGCTLRDELPESGIIIAEASSPRAVQQWTARRAPGMVLAGGVDFFSALLAADSPGNPRSMLSLPLPRPPGAAALEFFVSGSSTAVARAFAAAARRDQTPVFSLPLELAWGAVLRPEATAAIVGRIVSAFESHARVVLTVGLPPVRNEKVSRGLTGQLVQIAAAVLERVEVGQVYADGGATAAELVWRMGWSRLKLLREQAPGVATLAVAGKKNLWLTIKPGSYPWPVEWTASR